MSSRNITCNSSSRMSGCMNCRSISASYAVIYLGGKMAQRVQHWTCDQQVVGSNPTWGKSCITTLGKLFTPMYLCHQAV